MSGNPGRLKPEREAVAAVWRRKQLWLLHLVGNALLLGLGYAWLWIPDEKVWQVAVSTLLGFALLAAALWLHGGTLACFRQAHGGEEGGLAPVFRATLRRLPALAAWAALLLLVLWLVAWASDFTGVVSAWLASALTLLVRRPVSPETLARFLTALVWVVSWVVVPVLLLPLASQVAGEGFNGFRGPALRRAWALFRRERFWLDYVALFALGAYLPGRLIWWVPEVTGLTAEAASLVARFLAAYLLAVTAWVILLSLAARLGSAPSAGE